jgi:Uma2 family endonuclease
MVARLNFISPEEYLAIERKAEYKSEYINGQMYAMAGGTPEHNLVAGNALTALNIALRERPCLVFNSDMKVRVPSSMTTLMRLWFATSRVMPMMSEMSCSTRF